MKEALASAVRRDAPWRAFSALSASAALHELDAVVKARRASDAWRARAAAQGAEGQEARWRLAALETARLIVADIVEAERERETAP